MYLHIFRSRGVASHSKNDSLRPNYTTSYMLSPLTSTNFKINQSKSVQINKSYHSKSLLSKTLNKNSALVNLNRKSQFNTNTASSKYHPKQSPSPSNDNNHISWNNNNDIQNPKTFNPSKQWMDALLNSKSNEDNNNRQNRPNLSYNKYKSRPKAITGKNNSNKKDEPKKNQNGTLTYNGHTFHGIWANTSPKQEPIYDYDEDDDGLLGDEEKKYDINHHSDDEEEEDGDGNDDGNDEQKKMRKKSKGKINRKNTITIHSLFETKQSQQANNIYAYSVAPKYSVKEMDSINNTNND